MAKWCLQVISTGFNADYGLFTSTADGLAYPQPAATAVPNGLGLLEFLGLVMGKALYEGILLDVPLAPFFVARLQGRRVMFDDLAALDAELYRSLVQLKRYDLWKKHDKLVLSRGRKKGLHCWVSLQELLCSAVAQEQTSSCCGSS